MGNYPHVGARSPSSDTFSMWFTWLNELRTNTIFFFLHFAPNLKEKPSQGGTPYMFGCADSMIAMLVPKAPPKHISSRDGEIDDEDEDLVSALTEGFFDTYLYEVAVSELTIDRNCWRLIHCEGDIIFLLASVQRFKLQDSATPLQRRLARFMREKLRVPGK